MNTKTRQRFINDKGEIFYEIKKGIACQTYCTFFS